MYKTYPKKRYEHTISFLQEQLPAPARILDLGVENPFTEIMREAGYEVVNTGGEDLDFVRDSVAQEGFDAVTAFEIIEHLLNPLPLLQEVKAPKLIASIPMRLWFAPAYRSKTDMWDRHYHEFEDWQFDWLLEKAGWEIQGRKKWKSYQNIPLGVRPLLRRFTDRYYAVSAIRK